MHVASTEIQGVDVKKRVIQPQTSKDNLILIPFDCCLAVCQAAHQIKGCIKYKNPGSGRSPSSMAHHLSVHEIWTDKIQNETEGDAEVGATVYL